MFSKLFNLLKVPIFGLFILFHISLEAFAQNSTIQFCPTLNNAPLTLNSWTYIPSMDDSVKLYTLKCYITNLIIQFEDSSYYSQADSYHLINMSDTSSLRLNLKDIPQKEIASISFIIGTDSTLNTSGILDGDLDPIKGMYWTWTSGYVNFKVEGSCMKCKSRNKEFKYHIGGYLQPYETFQKTKLIIALMSESQISINFNLDEFFKHVNLEDDVNLMTTGKKAHELSNSFPSLFTQKL